jgi:hypothetical protein
VYRRLTLLSVVILFAKLKRRVRPLVWARNVSVNFIGSRAQTCLLVATCSQPLGGVKNTVHHFVFVVYLFMHIEK